MIEKSISGIHFTAGVWPLRDDLPTIIFIHGAGNFSEVWDSQVEELSEYANTVAIDLPGHGKSQGESKSSIDEYTESVKDFINELAPPSPYLCGHSMGGAIVMNYMAGNDVSGGILINTGSRLKVMPAIFDMVKNDFSGYCDFITKLGLSKQAEQEKIDKLRGIAGSCSAEAVFNDFTACNDMDLSADLEKIEAPVLILTADVDKLTPEKYGKFLYEKIPESTLVSIKQSGHFSQIEKAGGVNMAIAEFIRKQL